MDPHSITQRIWTGVRILNVRLRFIFLMVLVGLVAGNWDRIQNYYDRWRRPAKTPETAQASEIEFYCPMHPNIIRSQPGNCPICGMPLAKREKGNRKTLAEGVLAQVQMSPQKVQMGRIATTPVEYRLLAREIRALGTIEFDETKIAHASARIKGRLDHLYVNYVGQRVEKGDPLYSIYSPDLLLAQQELLATVRAASSQSAQRKPDETPPINVNAAKRKLLLWGITEEQISEIIRRGTAETDITVLSPLSGVVTEKTAHQGHYVTVGEDIYTLVDLSTVWLQARVFEDEIAGIAAGTAVAITTSAFPDETFTGLITFVAYSVEPTTRTLAARVEIANPASKLKPGMFATAIIRLPVGRVVEATASAPSPTSGPATDGLANSYTALVTAFAKDRSNLDLISDVEHEAHTLTQVSDEAVRLLSTALEELSKKMIRADLKGQRVLLKSLSAKVIELLRAHPPAGTTLFVIHCPMVDADWIQTSEQVANPYYGSAMLKCGQVTGRIEPRRTRAGEQFAEGYYCPIHPDRLFDEARECPIDKLPMKYSKVEKVLALPESAVINTGTRSVAYRETQEGAFDMVEVKLGQRAGESYPVLSGLALGDRVATRGAFLVDAENRLNPAASATYFGASDTKPRHGEHGGHEE